METREGGAEKVKLLQGELEQFSHMVQVLSYEVTILQDFMRENYGPRFEAYRRSHLRSQPAQQSRRQPQQFNLVLLTSPNQNQRRRGRREGVAHHSNPEEEESGEQDGGASEDENDGGDVDGGGGNGMEDPLTGYSSSDYVGDYHGDDDDGGSGPPDPDENMDGGDDHDQKLAPVGPAFWDRKKRRTEIWRQFIISKLPNGKLHARCRKCSNSVSSKVERLTTHYQKCSLGITPQRQASKRSAEEIDSKEKVTKLIQTQSQKKVKVDMTSSSTSNTDSIALSLRGRKMDPVWSYFHVNNDDPAERGRKSVVTCKTCGVKVSNKVERVRRHFILCNELDKAEATIEPGGGGDPTSTSSTSSAVITTSD